MALTLSLLAPFLGVPLVLVASRLSRTMAAWTAARAMAGGLITLLLGLNTAMSAVAAVFHIINHAIFKASLFMAAGIIDHECGTRDMRRIIGMFKCMPWTATLGILAAGSMAGVPLLNGFLSK